MRNLNSVRGSLLASLALALVACGEDVKNEPDPFNGVMTFDATGAGLDAKFMPISSTASPALQALCSSPPSGFGLASKSLPCYPVQIGYAKGKVIKFYNLLGAGTAVRTSPSATTSLFPIKASSLQPVYNFPGNCSPATIDPVRDAIDRSVQWPIFSRMAFPATQTGEVVLPLVGLYPLTSVSGNGCNDLKDADSVVAGKYGAKVAAGPQSAHLWAPVSPDANFMTFTSATPAPPTQTLWFRGMIGKYIDGGRVPLDADGNIVPMDGIILNPSGSGFANPYDSQAVLFPAEPGEDGFSPVVRLNQMKLPSGKSLGDFHGMCRLGASTCPSDYARMEDTLPPSPQSFNTIFIISSPQ